MKKFNEIQRISSMPRNWTNGCYVKNPSQENSEFPKGKQMMK